MLRHLFFLFFLALVAFGLKTKLQLTEGLSYTSDLFTVMQQSKSYLLGRGLFHDNTFGSNSYNHNFFLLLFLAPISYRFGVEALFAFMTALVVMAGWQLFNWSSHFKRELIGWPLIFSLLIGPISFWICDDPLYGGHAELVYLPLSILFGLSILRGSSWQLMWGAMLALTKEDGAVLAWAVHLISAFSLFSRGETHSKHNLGKFVLQALIITATWFAVFLVGMALLRVFAPAGQARLEEALIYLPKLLEDEALWASTLEMLQNTAKLLIPGLILFSLAPRLKVFLVFLIAAVPLIFIHLIGAFAYLPDLEAMKLHGMAWPPRFVSLWACTIVGVLAAAECTIYTTRRRKIVLMAVITILSWLLQVRALQRVRSYDFFEIARIPFGYRSERMYKQKLRSGEYQSLRCLAQNLPINTPMVVGSMYFGLFHKQDITGSETHDKYPDNPHLVICDQGNRLPYEQSCLKYFNSLSDITHNKIKVAGSGVAFMPHYQNIIEQCISRLKPTAP